MCGREGTRVDKEQERMRDKIESGLKGGRPSQSTVEEQRESALLTRDKKDGGRIMEVKEDAERKKEQNKKVN
jgi:hypothetical protein